MVGTARRTIGRLIYHSPSDPAAAAAAAAGAIGGWKGRRLDREREFGFSNPSFSFPDLFLLLSPVAIVGQSLNRPWEIVTKE